MSQQVILGKQVSSFEKSVRAKQHFSRFCHFREIVQKEDYTGSVLTLPFKRSEVQLKVVHIMNAEPKEKIAFYADCPDGQKNKLFSYRVHDLSHSIDMLNKFKAKGCQIRKAYHTFDNGKNMALDAVVKSLDGDLSGIYANVKNL